MHVEITITTVELADAIIEVDHRQTGKRLEAPWMFGVGFGKRIVDDSAQLQRFAPIAALFDPAAGIRKHANVDAVFIHDVDIFLMIEAVEADAANIALRLLGHELQKSFWKGVKMRIDNQVCLL